MNKVKILAFGVCIILLGLIFFSSGGNKNQSSNQSNLNADVTKENVAKVINNGGSVLKYNGYIYYIKATDSEEKGFNNKICRIDKNNKEEVIYDAKSNKIYDRLIIFNNNIFFSVVGKTYYANLENTRYVKEYNKGILYYIGDGNIIYAHNNNIFKATYYKNTLAINSIKEIATFIPNFMFEDEENLYFYSNNSDGSKSIISVNKEKQLAKVLDRYYPKEGQTLSLFDYKISEDYIYVVLNFGVPEAISTEYYDYRIVRIAKDGEKIESIDLDYAPSKYNYTYKNNFYFKYASAYSNIHEYNYKNNEISMIENVKGTHALYDVYSDKYSKKVQLIRNDEGWLILKENVSGTVSNVRIQEVNNYIYITFDLNNNSQREIMQWRVKKDGTNLERLNNK